MQVRMLLVFVLCCCAVNAWAQSSQSTLTDTTVVSAGNSQAQNVNGTGNTQALTLNGGQAQAQLPLTTNAVALPSPGIYGPLGKTPGAASVPFITAAQKLCGVRYTRHYQPEVKKVDETHSGQTILQFNPFPSLQAKAGSGVEVEEMDPIDLTASVYTKVKCLATVTSFTKEKHGDTTDFAVVQADVIKHLFKVVRGYRKVAVVSLIHSVSAASGVETAGWSASVGLAIGHIINGLTSMGIAPTGTMGAGRSNPTSFPGGTFLVLALDEADGQTVDMATLRGFFAERRLDHVTVPAPSAP